MKILRVVERKLMYYSSFSDNIKKDCSKLNLSLNNLKKCDRDRIRTYDRLLRRQMLYPAELRDLSINFVGVAGFEPATSASQTRRDNRATLHPEMAERQGFEPWRRLHVDRLAICSITTLAPLQYSKSI